MRYCWVWYIPVACAALIGWLWCYFVHSWCEWEKTNGGTYIFVCAKCGHEWHLRPS
jgi:hypothetical protein